MYVGRRLEVTDKGVDGESRGRTSLIACRSKRARMARAMAATAKRTSVVIQLRSK